ncbi:hypothetical protein ELE36_06625 [Pseudolysobacter antarcticus]|uniref:Signal transduction histidine kinase internal region domain-containing protein n=1 Tax=Pseudolysobacter antarcticus TaxID=2511995 RepID=A0A411HI28_9GAMM|nr:histidine kinase [Pseudolysobacter antarcticus]QBB70064.1 hypothetical protein ELE36_06625 [Pseudolysobacter antarcticus]
MSRGWVWLQLAVAWLPMWALFTAIIVIVHHASFADAAIGALRMIGAAALLGIAVYKFTSRMAWPHPFRLAFVLMHLVAASLYSVAWYVLISVIDSLVMGHFIFALGPGAGISLSTGIWLYIMVAGVAYANLAAERTARMEAHATRMQLDTLRSQLHPHFLFNALHTVVQLIPIDPRAAALATEQLAGTLRTTLEEQRDLITLGEEWAFVERYLAIESIRFGDRLRVTIAMEESTRLAMLPTFALQTLIENAIRHGAAPRIETTHVKILATLDGAMLIVNVADDGVGADIREVETAVGTGLRRLRERMRWLYGNNARLELASNIGEGFRASLIVPQSTSSDDIADRDRGHNIHD